MVRRKFIKSLQKQDKDTYEQGAQKQKQWQYVGTTYRGSKL